MFLRLVCVAVCTFYSLVGFASGEVKGTSYVSEDQGKILLVIEGNAARLFYEKLTNVQEQDIQGTLLKRGKNVICLSNKDRTKVNCTLSFDNEGKSILE